jgi:hypothetical protein
MTVASCPSTRSSEALSSGACGAFFLRVVSSCRAIHAAMETRSVERAARSFRVGASNRSRFCVPCGHPVARTAAEHPHPALRAHLPVPAHDRAVALSGKGQRPGGVHYRAGCARPSRCGRSNPVSSTTIFLPALPMRARNRVPSPMGSGVSISAPAIAGLNDGSSASRRPCQIPARPAPRCGHDR